MFTLFASALKAAEREDWCAEVLQPIRCTSRAVCMDMVYCVDY
jgi:hypothetical protein